MTERPNEMTASSPIPATPLPIKTEHRRRRVRREHEAQDPARFSAVARTTPERLARALEHARECARIADDNRGKEILLLDLRQATPLIDFFVIITATSRRLSRAIAEEIDKAMKRRGEMKLGIEGSEEGRWTLIDYGDFVVHVFSPEARAYYALEEIWGDAPQLDWQDPLRVRRGDPEAELDPETKLAAPHDPELEAGLP
jgi:ribosome-associated protein